ncbi:unnamed protein product, partial [Linum tenue]
HPPPSPSPDLIHRHPRAQTSSIAVPASNFVSASEASPTIFEILNRLESYIWSRSLDKRKRIFEPKVLLLLILLLLHQLGISVGVVNCCSSIASGNLQQRHFELFRYGSWYASW